MTWARKWLRAVRLEFLPPRSLCNALRSVLHFILRLRPASRALAQGVLGSRTGVYVALIVLTF